MLLRQVAAGMKTDLTVEMYAIAAGVEGERGVGKISHDLQITTETDNLLLPVSANILCDVAMALVPQGYTHCWYRPVVCDCDMTILCRVPCPRSYRN